MLARRLRLSRGYGALRVKGKGPGEMPALCDEQIAFVTSTSALVLFGERDRVLRAVVRATRRGNDYRRRM